MYTAVIKLKKRQTQTPRTSKSVNVWLKMRMSNKKEKVTPKYYMIPSVAGLARWLIQVARFWPRLFRTLRTTIKSQTYHVESVKAM